MTTAIDSRIAAEVAAVRTHAGLWLRYTHAFVRFTGPDVATWLQSQSTNDVLLLESGDGHANALVDRKAHLIAHFTLHRWDDEYWCLIERSQYPAFYESLDAHLFVEQVEIHNAADEVDQVVIQGPRSLFFLSTILEADETALSDVLPASPYGCHPLELLGHQTLAFRVSPTGEDGYVLLVPRGEGESLLDALLARGESFQISAVSEGAREVLRVEAGIPLFGIDMDATNRLPETTLERDGVSFTKGCYLGQEVIAKLKTYGSVKRALMGLVLDGSAPSMGATMLVDGKEIGEVRSACFSPTLQTVIALAYLDREYRAPDSSLTFETIPNRCTYRARVVVLPFVHALTREEHAHSLYTRALEAFGDDTHDESAVAIDLLREAIALRPTFEDAYECLGVILNRHHRVDEAIHFMKALAALNPSCIMAHTNLSVFYLAKGMIDEAEIEKAQAAVLELKLARDAKKAEELAAEERERIRREAMDRIRMFREVLEFDPEDPLATFGMGVAHMQLSEYEAAIPHLEQATRVQKDYSAAYLNLGKCHEFVGHAELAGDTYRRGIEVANRKGDLMPMREMERRLKSLALAPVTTSPTTGSE